MKNSIPILIHTHFHNRRTGVTRSVENVLLFFDSVYETYIYGYGVEGKKIGTIQLLKQLFSKRETVVHCHRNNEIMRMLLFRFFGAKFKLISTRHAETNPSGLTKFLLKKSDQIVTLTESMSNRLGLKNTVVSHGVDVDFFVPNSKKKLPEIHQKHIITSAGRVRKAKGTKILLQAAAPLLQKHSDWALVIVGKLDKPAFLEELKVIVEEYKIEKQVYFMEETPDILSVYQVSHTVIVPSFTEGFSLVCVEAMSCECNVIATKDVGVHSDLISDTKNGYLFEAGNSDALKNLLLKTIQQEIPHLGKNARQEVLDNWSSQKEAEGLIKVYQSN